MSYFIGIVPPEPILSQILEIQHEFGDNQTEPHITVKAQGGLDARESWIAKIEDLACSLNPFMLRLTKTKMFHEEVLFLAIESAPLLKLHAQLVRVINPSRELIEKYFELQGYIPHLTIGQLSHGFSRQNLEMMKNRVDLLLAKGKMEFSVDYLRVYKKTDQAEKYAPFKDIPLKGNF